MIAYALRATDAAVAGSASVPALRDVAEPDSAVLELGADPFVAAAVNEALDVLYTDEAVEAVVVLDGHTVLAALDPPLPVRLRAFFAGGSVVAVALGPSDWAAGIALSRWALRHLRFQQRPLEVTDLVVTMCHQVEAVGRSWVNLPEAATVVPGGAGLAAVGPLFPPAEAGAPTVSVLIPTFNRAELVDQAITSVTNQTLRDFEVVVSDSGSTDRSVEVLDRWTARDSRVRWTSTGDDLGSSYNWRQCLTGARGRYVKWVMSDDLLAPNALARLVAALEAVPEASIAFSKRSAIDLQGRPLPDTGSTQALAARDGVLDGLELGDAALRANLNIVGEPTTVLVRRDAFWLGNPWTVDRAFYRVNSDLALWLRLLASGPAAYIVEPLSFFRRHPGQDQVVRARAVAEWYQLIDEGHRLGYLAGSDSLEAALRRFVLVAESTVDGPPPGASQDVLDDFTTLAVAVAAARDRLGVPQPTSGPTGRA